MLEFIFCKDQKYMVRTVLCAQNGGLKLKFGLAVEELHGSNKTLKIMVFWLRVQQISFFKIFGAIFTYSIPTHLRSE